MYICKTLAGTLVALFLTAGCTSSSESPGRGVAVDERDSAIDLRGARFAESLLLGNFHLVHSDSSRHSALFSLSLMTSPKAPSRRGSREAFFYDEEQGVWLSDSEGLLWLLSDRAAVSSGFAAANMHIVDSDFLSIYYVYSDPSSDSGAPPAIAPGLQLVVNITQPQIVLIRELIKLE